MCIRDRQRLPWEICIQYPTLLWVPWQLYHNTLHFCEFCSTSGTLQRLPSGSVYRRQQYPRYGWTFVELPSTIVITPGGWRHLQEPTLKCTLTNNTQNRTLPYQRIRNRSVTEHTIRHAASEREHERCRPQQFIYARSWWHLSFRRLGCVYSGEKWGGTEYWV